MTCCYWWHQLLVTMSLCPCDVMSICSLVTGPAGQASDHSCLSTVIRSTLPQAQWIQLVSQSKWSMFNNGSPAINCSLHKFSFLGYGVISILQWNDIYIYTLSILLFYEQEWAFCKDLASEISNLTGRIYLSVHEKDTCSDFMNRENYIRSCFNNIICNQIQGLE